MCLCIKLISSNFSPARRFLLPFFTSDEIFYIEMSLNYHARQDLIENEFACKSHRFPFSNSIPWKTAISCWRKTPDNLGNVLITKHCQLIAFYFLRFPSSILSFILNGSQLIWMNYWNSIVLFHMNRYSYYSRSQFLYSHPSFQNKGSL